MMPRSTSTPLLFASPRAKWTIVVGLFLSLIFLAIACYRIEWSEVGRAIASADPWPWLPLAIASYLAGHFMRGARLRLFVRHDANLTTATASNIVVIGYAGNNLLPARAGELARVAALSERTGLPVGQSLAVTFLERLLDGLTILLLLIVAAATSNTTGWIGPSTRIAAMVFAVAALGVAAAVIAPNPLAEALARLASLANDRWREPALRFAIQASRGVSFLRRPGDALAAGVLSLAVWLLEAGLFLFLLPAFGLPLDLRWGLLAMAVTNLALLIPSTPGFIGHFHLFCAGALIALGVGKEVALSYAILVHVAFYVPVTAWGLAALSRYGIELGALRGLTRSVRDVPAVDIDALIGRADSGGSRSAKATPQVTVLGPVPNPFLRALVEASLPLDTLKLSESDEKDCVNRTAAFVASQIDALPRRLNVLFAIGTSAFRVYVLVRCLNDFHALAPAHRRRVFESWAYGPIPLFRALFRVVRSTSLLDFYEIVSVREALAAQAEGETAQGASEIKAIPTERGAA